MGAHFLPATRFVNRKVKSDESVLLGALSFPDFLSFFTLE
jgi:hypothetical protein